MVTTARRRKRSNTQWIGLDIGSRSIKLAQVERTAAGLRLVRSLVRALPTDSSNVPAEVASHLQAILREARVDRVHLSVSGAEVAIRRVRVPPMSADELPEAAKWQVKDEVPFPIQDAVLDLCVLGEVVEQQIKKQELLVAVAPASVVRSQCALVEPSGVRVESLTPTATAVWRCVRELYPTGNTGTLMVVEVGGIKTEVTVIKDGDIQVVRELSVGCVSLTHALVGTASSDHGDVTIDDAKAEMLIRQYGILSDVAEGTTTDGVRLFHVASLMRPVLEHLLTELSRILDFYRVQVDEAGVSRILLCGAGATLKQFAQFLSEGIGTPVDIFDPIAQLLAGTLSTDTTPAPEHGTQLVAAVGLALSHGEDLNFLAPRQQRHRRTASLRWLAVVRWVLGPALVVGIGLAGMLARLEWQVRNQEQAWRALEPASVRTKQILADEAGLSRTMEQIQRLWDDEPVWEGILKELGTLVPEGVTFNELTVTTDDPPTHRQLHLKGTLRTAGRPDPGSLTQFVDALQRSIFFQRVELVNSQLHGGDSTAVDFDIEALFR